MNWPWKKKKLSFAETAKFNWEADTNEELRQILQMNNIRLLERLTDQKAYTRIMNMNNTVLSIRLEAAENDGANDGTC